MAGRGPGRGRGARDNARRPAASRPSAPRRPAKGAAVVPGRAEMSTRRWIILGSVLIVVAVLLGPTLTSYLKQRGEISDLRSQVAAQQRSVTELEQEKARWEEPEYVEQQARERLKFVKVGEKAYTVIDADPDLDTGDGSSTSAFVDEDASWVDQFWASAQAADDPNVATP
ncbi:FtsB family cell division protein [Janibacter sp. G56]|uniref:FtsB family cell division protein n=1 Tax=Janibacter sp. G56 TaxID=3418717 RepID=UPI003D02B3C8